MVFTPVKADAVHVPGALPIGLIRFKARSYRPSRRLFNQFVASVGGFDGKSSGGPVTPNLLSMSVTRLSPFGRPLQGNLCCAVTLAP